MNEFLKGRGDGFFYVLAIATAYMVKNYLGYRERKEIRQEERADRKEEREAKKPA